MKQHRGNAKILIVDDDPNFRTILRLTLQSCGYNRLREAWDVVTALRLLGSVRFDLVLLDWWLGTIQGIELARTISHQHIDVPVIMLTSEKRKECIVESMRLGVVDYLLKPYMRHELVAKIDNALSARWGIPIEP